MGDAGHGGGELALAMLVVFGSAKLLGELCERLGQPAIVGEILAGILIGPSVLGWISPNEVLTALAELGVAFLLFNVGLEVKSSELMRVGGTALLVAAAGVVVPFIFGWGIMTLWGASTIEAFFMAAAMVATSIGITAQVLASKGLLDQISARIILAAAVIDDVLGLLVLALVSSMAKGDVNFLGLAVTGLLAAGFTVVVAKWGSKTMNRVVPRVEARLRSVEGQFTLSMLLLFALSLGAVYAGVAAIIGAFLAGMALSETVNHRVHDLTNGVTELLTPFFLVGIGLHLDLSVFSHAGTIVLSLLILVAAILSKLAGCGLGALALGWRDALRVGVGMMPRGEVGLVVAQLGFAMGVVEKGTYGVVVFMALATTIVAPPALAVAYRGVQGEKPEERYSVG